MAVTECRTKDKTRELVALKALLTYAKESAEEIGAERLATAIDDAFQIAIEESRDRPPRRKTET